MHAQGVVIGAPRSCVTLIANGAAKAPANPDFASDYPATVHFETGPHSGVLNVDLIGTPAKYAAGFAESLEALTQVSAETKKPYWRMVRQWPFIRKLRNGLPSAQLLSVGGELHVDVQAVDTLGHIIVSVKVRPEGRSGYATFAFDWGIDQSYLPTLMQTLRREFPGL